MKALSHVREAAAMFAKLNSASPSFCETRVFHFGTSLETQQRALRSRAPTNAIVVNGQLGVKTLRDDMAEYNCVATELCCPYRLTRQKGSLENCSQRTYISGILTLRHGIA